MDDEVHQLVLVHLLRVKVGDEEADVVSLKGQDGKKSEVKAVKTHTFNWWCDVKLLFSI